MKYAFIERNRHCWPVSVQCAVLSVSPSGYHQRQRHAAHHRMRGTGARSDSYLAEEPTPPTIRSSNPPLSDGLIYGLKRTRCRWFLVEPAGMKKGPSGPIFNDLQTSLELCRSNFGAGNESRTRDLNLGKVALYQLSYSRIFLWRREPESNRCTRLCRPLHNHSAIAPCPFRPAIPLPGASGPDLGI